MIVKYNKNRKQPSKKKQFEKAVREEVQKVLKEMDINESVKALEPKQGVKEIKKELEESIKETNTISNDEKEQSKKTDTTSDKPKRKRGRPRKETK